MTTFYCTDHYQDTADVELIPEREDTQPDSPLEDTVSVTLKRENSIRRSQRHGRLEHSGVVGDKIADVMRVRVRKDLCEERELPLGQ